MGNIGKNGRKAAAAAMLNMLPKFELVPMSRYFITLPKARRPSTIPSSTARRLVLEQDDVGGVLGYVDRAVD